MRELPIVSDPQASNGRPSSLLSGLAALVGSAGLIIALSSAGGRAGGPASAARVDDSPLVIVAAADSWVAFDVGTGIPISEEPHGADPSLNIGLWDTGEDMNGLLRFGAPPEVLASRVRRAELWLSITSAESISIAPDGSRKAASLQFKPALDPWDEATVIGKARPRSGAPETSADVAAGLLKLDFTEPARAWLAGDRPHGWVLRGGSLATGATIGVSIWIASRESGNGPKLVLYTDDDATPTPTGPTPTSPPTATSNLTAIPSASSTARPTPPVAYGNGLLFLGQTHGRPRDVGVSGGHAVLALDGELVVYDVRSPEAPVEVARLPLGLAVYRLLVRGDRAYAAGDGAVWVVDLSDPREPAVLGSAPLEAMAVDMALTGDRLFVIQEPLGHVLRVFDVSDPARVRSLGRVAGNFTDVDADGGLVIVARTFQHASSALEVYVAADMPAAAPIVHMGQDAFDSVHLVAISGDYGYVVGRSRLTILDLADPAQPRQVAAMAWLRNATIVRAQGSRLFFADPWLLTVVNVADPSHPFVQGGSGVNLNPWPLRTSVNGLWVGIGIEADTVVHASDDAGFSVVSVGQSAPRKAAHVDMPPHMGPADLAVAGDEVLVADLLDAVLRVDMSKPAAPVIADRHASALGQTVAVAVEGDRRFALFWDSECPCAGTFAELDRDAPGLPVRASISFTSTVHTAAVVGGRAYIVGWEVGLVVVDVPPGGPFVELGRYRGARLARDIAVAGPIAYVTDAELGLMAIDVAEPSAPRLLGRLALPGRARRLALAGRRAYVVWADSDALQERLGVVDIADPAAMTLSPLNDMAAGTLHVDAANACLFTSDGSALRVYDIGRPEAPRLLDAWPRLALTGIATEGSRLFATSFEMGLLAFSYDCAERQRAARSVWLPVTER